MTTFTRTWDASYEASPPDSQAASQGATRIREVKQDIRERLAVDHSMAGDANDGAHNKATLLEQSADPTAAANTGFVYAKDVGGITELFYEDSSGNVIQVTNNGSIDAGTLDGIDSTGFLQDVANSVSASNISAGAITQGKLSTATTGLSVSVTGTIGAGASISNWTFAITAEGNYGLASTIRTYKPATTYTIYVRGSSYPFYYPSASTAAVDTGYVSGRRIDVSAYNAGGSTEGTSRTYYAYQQAYYIQASPPYNLGDGEVGRFCFILIDNERDVIESIYHAKEAPWHYNGPTNIKADFYRKGKGYRFRRDMRNFPFTLDEAKADPVKLAEYIAAFKSAPIIEQEITQEIKNADMQLLPHPFFGNNLERKTVVMLDPVCDLNWQLTEMCDGYDQFNLNELIHEGHIVIDNEPINRAGPPGVPVVGFKWKNTRKA